MPLMGWRGNVARHMANQVTSMEALRRQYGDVACLVKSGNQPLFFRPSQRKSLTVFAFGAQRNREVLAQPNVFESDFLRAPEKCQWMIHNMGSANREHRARQRRMIMPAFTRNHLQVYHTDIVDLVNKMFSRWELDKTIDFAEEMENFTAAVASKIFYGQDPEQHHRNLANIARDIANAQFSPATMIPLDIPGSPYRRFLKMADQAGAAVLEEIQRRRTAGCGGNDALSIMIKAHDEDDTKLSDAELIGNAFSLFLAGHKAPAAGLALTLFLLAQHPTAMAELVDELEGHLNGEPPKFEDIWKLPVLDRVVRESLRLLCPAMIVWRRLTSAAQLGPYEVPAGSEILVSPYMTHIDPEIYDQPKKYLPERWNQIKPSSFEYLPFSYGARKCLGAALGEMLVKLVVAMVSQRFRLQIVPGTKIDFQISFSIRAKPGLPMVVRRQDRRFHESSGEVRGFVRQMVDFG